MKHTNVASVDPKLLTLQYCLVNAGYYVAFCCLFGYATTTLLGKGFEVASIGIVIAAGNLLSLLLQPVVAGFADRSKTLTVHQLILIMFGITAAVTLVFIFMPGLLIPIAIIYVLICMVGKATQPLVNSISVYYINHGVNVDFGLPRSIGTLFYAIGSTVLGYVYKYFGSNAIMVVFIIGLAISGLGIFIMPILPDETMVKTEEKQTSRIGILSFVKKYPFFCLTFLGTVLLMVFHNMVETYMIQILGQWNGDSTNQGTALTIAAMAEFLPMMCFAWLHKKLTTRQILMISGIAYTIRGIIYVFAAAIFHVYIAQVFQAFSYALLIPSSVYFANEMMEPEDTFTGQAVMSAAIVAGGMIASLLGGFILDLAGIRPMLITGVIAAAAGTVLIGLSFRGKRA